MHSDVCVHFIHMYGNSYACLLIYVLHIFLLDFLLVIYIYVLRCTGHWGWVQNSLQDSAGTLGWAKGISGYSVTFIRSTSAQLRGYEIVISYEESEKRYVSQVIFSQAVCCSLAFLALRILRFSTCWPFREILLVQNFLIF